MSATTQLSTIAFTRAPEPTLDVVVGGAGFVGTAVTLALAQGLPPGARITLIDRATRGPRGGHDPAGRGNAPADGRAVALTAASVRLLTVLGVWPQLAAAAQPVAGIEITDSALRAGLRRVLLSYDTVIPPSRTGADTVGDMGAGETSLHIVPNAALETALASALEGAIARNPGVRWLDGSAITAVAPGPEATRLTLADGRHLDARVLIASDGRRSPLRQLAGIGTVGWPYRQHGITVIVAHDAPHNGIAVQHFLPGGPLALLPLPGDRTCVTWSEDEREAARIMALEDGGFLAELDRRVGGRLGTLRLDGQRQSWPLDMFMARAFVGKRLALAGDAAHGVHPIAGQGLNLGFKDVAALAEVMVDQARLGLDIGAPDTLRRYERWRRFDTMTAAAGFDALNRMFSNDVGVLRSLRSLGLELVDRSPFLKRGLIEEAAGVTGTLPRLLRGERI